MGCPRCSDEPFAGHDITLPLTADYEWLDADYESYLVIHDEENATLGDDGAPWIADDFRTWLTKQPIRYLHTHGIIVNARATVACEAHDALVR